MELVPQNLLCFSPPPFLVMHFTETSHGSKGSLAYLLHFRRFMLLVFQSIYYEIKWKHLGLIPYCKCIEKKYCSALNIRSLAFKSPLVFLNSGANRASLDDTEKNIYTVSSFSDS